MKIFDNSNSLIDKRKSGRGRKSKELVITINPNSKRMYFSALLVKKYKLLRNGVRFSLEGKSSWYLLVDKNKGAIPLVEHRGSYFVYSKAIVDQLEHFSPDGVTSFRLGVIGHERYKLLLVVKEIGGKNG